MDFPPPSPRQARTIWLALTGLAIAVLVGLAVGLVWGIGQVLQILSPVLWPLAIAGVLSYLLDPVVDWLQARFFSRRTSIIVVFLLALVIIGGLFASVVPRLVTETKQLAERVPAYVERAQVRLQEYIDNPPGWAAGLLRIPSETEAPAPAPGRSASDAEPADTNAVEQADAVAQTNVIAPDAEEPGPTPGTAAKSRPTLTESLDRATLQSAGGWLATALPKIGSFLLAQAGRVASWGLVIAALALIPIYTYYLLAEKKGIQSKWTNYLPVSDSKFKDEMVFVLSSANDYMIAFFRGQVLVAICDGILYTIGFLIIGLPYAVLLGFISIFLTIIPYLGAIITCAIALLLAFMQHGDWLHPMLVLVVFIIVQGLEGFLIAPQILGDKIGLHPLTIIIVVMAGTTLMGGILGGILAIPMTALAKVVMFRYVWKRPEPVRETGGRKKKRGT
jgi:predicted PurR-regulated permease PerM